jgi:hypothetical protein
MQIGQGIQIGNGIVIATPPMTVIPDTTMQILSTNSPMTGFSPLRVSDGTNPYRFNIVSGVLPPGVTLDTTSGIVSGTPTATFNGIVTFGVQDSVGYRSGVTSTVIFTVVIAITATTNTTSQILEVGLTMSSFSPLTAVNGFTPYNYFVTAGSLPAGLSINPTTGAVTGTPTASQTATSTTFAVNDASNKVASNTSAVSFTVYSRITATADSATRVLTRNVSMTSFSPVVAANGSGTYTYYVLFGTLPPGLTLNPSTGTLSGIPSVAQSASSVIFAVRDSLNVVASQTSTVSFTVVV